MSCSGCHNSNTACRLSLHRYANFNNFHGRLYSPGSCQCGASAAAGGSRASSSYGHIGTRAAASTVDDPNTGALSFDWFEFARSNASTLLWTEDWFPDSDAHRWSYYLARLRSAAALSPNPATSFSGYIVPRSSGQFHGGLLQRVLTMASSGSKLVKYFTWGPEYIFPVRNETLHHFTYSSGMHREQLSHQPGQRHRTITLLKMN